MKREDSNCITQTEPTPLEKARARKSFVNRARALLTHLGFDPTPDNVDKIEVDADGKTMLLNGRVYSVLDNEETIRELEFALLKEPKRLPSNILAIFLTGAFPKTLDFQVIVAVAASLRRDKSFESNWALHKLIELDDFLDQHIQEVIDQTGIDQLFYGQTVSQVSYQGNNYVIIDRGPANEIKVPEDCDLFYKDESQFKDLPSIANIEPPEDPEIAAIKAKGDCS